MQEEAHAGLGEEVVPDPFEQLRVVRHAGAGTVGIGAEKHAVLGVEPVDDAVGDAADDLAGPVAGGEEAVERVEDLRRRAAGEAVAFDEQHAVAAVNARPKRRATSRRPGAHDENVGVGEHGDVGM